MSGEEKIKQDWKSIEMKIFYYKSKKNLRIKFAVKFEISFHRTEKESTKDSAKHIT